MTEQSELAVPDDAAMEQVPQSQVTARYNPAVDDWDSMAGEAHTVMGYDLAKDELADELAGVDFLITRLIFRPGVVRKVGTEKKQFAYVSAEAVINPVLNLKKVNIGRKGSELPEIQSLSELPFGPGDHVVINDGSTGIYRQCTQYLESTGLIRIGSKLPEQGEMGECRYDLPPSDWEATSDAIQYRIAANGTETHTADIRLRCPRGLRISRYDNEYTNGETATTRYLG